MGNNILKRSIIVSIIILLLLILGLPVLTSEGKSDLINKEVQSNSTNEEMKHPEFYSGLVWGHYTKIERSFSGIEVWCNMSDIEFGYFHNGIWLEFYNIEWLDISFFFGFARFGVIFGLAFHTYVG